MTEEEREELCDALAEIHVAAHNLLNLSAYVGNQPQQNQASSQNEGSGNGELRSGPSEGRLESE